MNKFITIFGQKQNGKSTFAQYLQAALHKLEPKRVLYSAPLKLTFTITGFAQPLRELTCKLLNCRPEFIEEWKNRYEPPPGMLVPIRYFMVELAKVIRSGKPDYFIERALKKAFECPIILEDGRFKDELEVTKLWKGYSIFIVRPDEFVKPYAETTGVCIDETERYCGVVASNVLRNEVPVCNEFVKEQGFNHIVVNNSTLENLQDVANQLAYKINNTYLAPEWPGEK